MGNLDGPKNKLEEQNQEIIDAVQEELNKWEAAGMDPDNVGHNIFQLDVQLQTIAEILEKSGVIDTWEFKLTFNRRMLNKLQELRSMYEPQVRQQRIVQGIEKPKEIILPAGLRYVEDSK